MNDNFSIYVWKEKKWQIILVLLILAGTILILFWAPNFFSSHIGYAINFLSCCATVLIAAFVWFNEQRKNWKNSLPKKLNIIYRLDCKDFALVKNAPLTGENDIRNWGQSIGQTILNQKTGIYFSGFNIEGPQLSNRKKEKKSFSAGCPAPVYSYKLVMLYKLTVYLFKAIDGIESGEEFFFDDDGNLSQANRAKISAKEQTNTSTTNKTLN